MPATDASAEIHARYWTAQNAMRFQAAMAQESAGGVALCDTDPLKLHYDWCMGRAGFGLIDRFSVSKPMVRDAILQEKLGFADLYLVKQVEPETARKQKEEDSTRRRSNFERHLALQPHLIEWYSALSRVFPGRVRFGYPDYAVLSDMLQQKAPEVNPRRFDALAFDQLMAELPD